MDLLQWCWMWCVDFVNKMMSQALMPLNYDVTIKSCHCIKPFDFQKIQDVKKIKRKVIINDEKNLTWECFEIKYITVHRWKQKQLSTVIVLLLPYASLLTIWHYYKNTCVLSLYKFYNYNWNFIFNHIFIYFF